MHSFMQNNLYIVPKNDFNIAIFTNRKNIQQFFKKIVDNTELLWYHNQAVTKDSTGRKPEGRNLKPSNQT